MSTVLQIYEAIDRLAPFFLSMDFDNTGILVGDRQKKVERALLALDCTKAVSYTHLAKSCGELQANIDPQMSEWSNPHRVTPMYHTVNL